MDQFTLIVVIPLGVISAVSAMLAIYYGVKTGWSALTPDEIVHNKAVIAKKRKAKLALKRAKALRKRQAKEQAKNQKGKLEKENPPAKEK